MCPFHNEDVTQEEWQRICEQAEKPICFNFLVMPMVPEDVWDRNKVGNKMGLRPASFRTEKTGIENKVGNFQAENHAHRMN